MDYQRFTLVVYGRHFNINVGGAQWENYYILHSYYLVY
jgi:hypothetical protein